MTSEQPGREHETPRPTTPIEPAGEAAGAPGEPGEAGEPGEPGDAIEPDEPGEAIEPGEPGEAIEPDEPGEPGEPGEPIERDPGAAEHAAGGVVADAPPEIDAPEFAASDEAAQDGVPGVAEEAEPDAVEEAEDESDRPARESDAPPVPSDDELPQRIEALLFVSDGGVEESALSRALGVTRRRLHRALDALAASLREHGRGVRLQRGPEGVQLVTAPDASPYVEYFLGLESARRLSTAALETLAIIAYRHPVTRGTIETIRGVSSDAAIATLRARGLIAEGGRAEGPGRPVLWVTTQRFLQHFGLERPDDLPPLPDDLELPDEPAGAQLPLGATEADGDLAEFTLVAGATLAGHPAEPADAGAPVVAIDDVAGEPADAGAPDDDRGGA